MIVAARLAPQAASVPAVFIASVVRALVINHRSRVVADPVAPFTQLAGQSCLADVNAVSAAAALWPSG